MGVGGGGSGPTILPSGSTYVINAWAYDADGSALVWNWHVTWEVCAVCRGVLQWFTPVSSK